MTRITVAWAGSSGICFYFLGYRDKLLLGFSLAEVAPTVRLESGLFGIGPRYGKNFFSYALDTKAPYFDGRVETDLELMLQYTKRGIWKEALSTKNLIKNVTESSFQKYPEVDKHLNSTLSYHDIVVVGQCEGDAAWEETDTLVKSNLELIEKAKYLFPQRKIYYKPHPFNKKNGEDIMRLKLDPLLSVINPKVSFAKLALSRPIIVLNTSCAGLEAALRGCEVYNFGTSFYSHWGFTVDQTQCSRRTNKLDPQDVFFVLMVHYCKYAQRNPLKPVGVEEAALKMYGISSI